MTEEEMTPQDKVKEGIHKHIKNTLIACNQNPITAEALALDTTLDIVKTLHSQNVAIKVKCQNCQDGYVIFRTNKKRCSVCKGNGYVAPESIIKEEVNGA